MTEEDESLPQDAAEDMAEAEVESEATDDGSFFIPSDALSGREFKAGDMLTFEVIGLDSEGDVEVRMSEDAGKPKGDFVADLRKEMMTNG